MGAYALHSLEADPFGNQAMPALLAAAMKWEPICGTRGIEFLADLSH